jgi:hypothetical protein
MRLVLELTDPTGAQVGRRTYTLATAQREVIEATGVTTGWCTFRIRPVNPPPTNPKPGYKLTVMYQAPQETAVKWRSSTAG